MTDHLAVAQARQRWIETLQSGHSAEASERYEELRNTLGPPSILVQAPFVAKEDQAFIETKTIEFWLTDFEGQASAIGEKPPIVPLHLDEEILLIRDAIEEAIHGGLKLFNEEATVDPPTRLCPYSMQGASAQHPRYAH